jgi:hypothetical protein
VEEQLNGGQFAKMTDADWKLIEPYLEENEKLFDITLTDCLTVDGEKKARKMSTGRSARKKWGCLKTTTA